MPKSIAQNIVSSGEQIIHRGLTLNFPELDHWILGSGKASERFGAGDINPSGDWSKWLPNFEAQKQFNFETMGCAVFATLKPWIVLAKFYGFDDFPKDCSERYSGVLCGVLPSGSDPHANAENMRTYSGVLPQELMPWNSDIDTWIEYYDRSHAYANLPLGQKYKDKFELGHEWIWPFGSSLSPEEKTTLLEAALKRGPVSVSVSGNYRTRRSAYYKDPTDRDTHWITVTRMERGARIMDDQYEPFVKRFEKDYDHDAAKVYFLQRKVETSFNFWDTIINIFTLKWIKSSSQ